HTLVAPHRDGGQSQFVQARAWEGTRESPLGEAMSWSREHLDRRISLAVLARESKTSVRTLSRRFREATGMTPLQWVRTQRLALAVLDGPFPRLLFAVHLRQVFPLWHLAPITRSLTSIGQPDVS